MSDGFDKTPFDRSEQFRADVAAAADAAEMRTRLLNTADVLTKAFHRRLEREAVAAWMAGYTGLDVVTPPEPYTRNDGDGVAFSFQASFVPRRIEVRKSTPTGDVYPTNYRVERYDLTELDAQTARDVRQSWGDTDETDDPDHE